MRRPRLTRLRLRWVRQVLLGSWQFSSVDALAKSGTPFSVRTTDGPGNGNIDGAGSDRPHLLDPDDPRRTRPLIIPDTSVRRRYRERRSQLLDAG